MTDEPIPLSERERERAQRQAAAATPRRRFTPAHVEEARAHRDETQAEREVITRKQRALDEQRERILAPANADEQEIARRRTAVQELLDQLLSNPTDVNVQAAIADQKIAIERLQRRSSMFREAADRIPTAETAKTEAAKTEVAKTAAAVQAAAEKVRRADAYLAFVAQGVATERLLDVIRPIASQLLERFMEYRTTHDEFVRAWKSAYKAHPGETVSPETALNMLTVAFVNAWQKNTEPDYATISTLLLKPLDRLVPPDEFMAEFHAASARDRSRTETTEVITED